VGAVSLPVNQHVTGMRHIYSHPPHAKAPTRREALTASVTCPRTFKANQPQNLPTPPPARSCNVGRLRFSGIRTQRCPLLTRDGDGNFLRHPIRKLGMSSSEKIRQQSQLRTNAHLPHSRECEDNECCLRCKLSTTSVVTLNQDSQE